MTTLPPPRHPEAFRLLRYRCAACGFVEVVWNSRDGRVPNAIDCAASLTTCVYQHGGDSAYVESIHSWFQLVAVGHDPAMVSQRCDGAADLINWPGISTYARGLAEFVPDHDPLPGERYFRDGIPAEARAIIRERMKRLRDTVDPESPAVRRYLQLVGDVSLPRPEGWIEEFPPGWPMLVVRGTDADGLPMRENGREGVGR